MRCIEIQSWRQNYCTRLKFSQPSLRLFITKGKHSCSQRLTGDTYMLIPPKCSTQNRASQCRFRFVAQVGGIGVPLLKSSTKNVAAPYQQNVCMFFFLNNLSVKCPHGMSLSRFSLAVSQVSSSNSGEAGIDQPTNHVIP